MQSYIAYIRYKLLSVQIFFLNGYYLNEKKFCTIGKKIWNMVSNCRRLDVAFRMTASE